MGKTLVVLSLSALLLVGGIIVWSARRPSPVLATPATFADAPAALPEREALPLFLAVPDSGSRAEAAPKATSDEGAKQLLDEVARARAAGHEDDADRQLADAVNRFPADERVGAAAVERASALLEAHPEQGEALLRTVAAAAPRSTSGVHASLLIAARLVKQGKVSEAAKVLSASLAQNRDTSLEGDLKIALEPLVRRLFFSSQVIPDLSFGYVVAKGDSLDRLVKTWKKDKGVNVTPGFVAKVNGMADPSRIQPGMTLKIPSAPLHLEVSKHAFRLVLFCGDVPILERRVGLGKGGKTPEGTFVIRDKQVHPVWFRPGEAIPYGDPRNPLGTRWMGFEATEQHAGYGIHGTTAPDSIGKEMSDGCVRMLNAEVEELFELVPAGTEVKIVP
jgi:L,D-transpeptidase-like protein/LysM domain-containing protein